MNLFKGLLFLHGHLSTVERADDIARPQYGARTAAAEIAPQLGNRVVSRRWFGARANEPAALAPAGCVTGSCG